MYSWRFSIKKKELIFRLMQSVRTWFYHAYCCRVYLACSVVGTRDLQAWLTLIHTWCRFLSVPRRLTWCLLWSAIVLLLLLYTIPFGEGHTGISCMCYPIFMQGIICEKTFRSFQHVILLTYSKTISPSRTSIGSTKCDHLYWAKLHDELLFGGGRAVLSSSIKRKALYTLLYLVNMFAVCSVVGSTAATLLYVPLDRY